MEDELEGTNMACKHVIYLARYHTEQQNNLLLLPSVPSCRVIPVGREGRALTNFFAAKGGKNLIRMLEFLKSGRQQKPISVPIS